MDTYMIYNPTSHNLKFGECHYFIPINKDTSFAYIISTLRPNICFIVNEYIPSFCEDCKYILAGYEEGCPMKLFIYCKAIYQNNNKTILKIGGNTFLQPICVDYCKRECQVDDRCIYAERHGDFTSGVTHGKFNFPISKYYYLNRAVTKVFCKSFAEEGVNEDISVGLYLQRSCYNVHCVDSECGVKREFNAYDTYHKIIKNENH